MISEILNALLRLFETGSNLNQAQSDRRDAALDAIYMACCETKAYVVNHERTSERDYEIEKELAILWKKASIPVREFDETLADKCYYKGEYWLDPDHWDDVDTKRLAIGLEQVIHEARDLKAT